MEQLAERRMQREEDAQHSDSRFRHQSMQPHNHDPPLDDDGDYDEEEDEDYDSQEEDEEDYDEMVKRESGIRISTVLIGIGGND